MPKENEVNETNEEVVEETQETSEKTAETSEETNDGKTFTQADVNRMIKERLDREKKKRDDAAEKARLEAERKQLSEQEQYKELAEKLQTEVDAHKTQLSEAKRDSLLANAGYNAEQVERYRKFVTGETDEELAQAVADLVEDIPPKKNYVDPSAGNPEKKQPEPKDATESGRQLVRDLIAKGKLRGMKNNKEEK
jgi:hypothetical protein